VCYPPGRDPFSQKFWFCTLYELFQFLLLTLLSSQSASFNLLVDKKMLRKNGFTQLQQMVFIVLTDLKDTKNGCPKSDNVLT